MPVLLPYVDPRRRLYAAKPVVDQFELLLGQFGGEQEKQRWAELLQRIEIVQPESLTCFSFRRTRDLLGPMQSISTASTIASSCAESDVHCG